MHSSGNELIKCLLKQFDISWQLLSYHMDGLTIDECLWEVSDKGVLLSKLDDGRYKGYFPETEAYEIGAPNIAWLTWHIDFWWSMVINHSFGDGTLSSDVIEWTPSVATIKLRFETLKAQWIKLISGFSDSDLHSMDLSKFPIRDCPFSDIVAWLNLELMKNAAEIGYARFLYASLKS